MATPFTRTLRSIHAEGGARGRLALLVGALLLGGWLVWMLKAEVSVYVASPDARIEVDRLIHPLQAPVSGRIARLHLVLAQPVEAGDVLVELDVEPQRLELAQARARLAAIGPEIAALRAGISTIAGVQGDERVGAAASLAEASALHREAAASAALAERELERATRLRAEGLLSEADLARARADMDARRASADALKAGMGRVAALRRADAGDRLAKKQELERYVAALEGEARTTAVDIQRLEHEVARRVLHATVDGEVAELAAVTVGSVLREGDRIGAILPAGRLRGVAELMPTDAFGRVRPGQQGRLRLDAFPWTQHGTIPAQVTHVASEVRDGRVRVELSVDEESSLVPLKHGLPGVVEIEVERTSPAVLVLRAAGKLLDPPSPAHEPTARAAPGAAGAP
jgi:multidrug resistance efflux pump